MDAGLPRVEFETLGRIASAVANTRENRAPSDKNQRISAFLAQLHQLGRLKSDRLLGGFTRCTKKCEVRFFADIDVQCNGILDTDPD